MVGIVQHAESYGKYCPQDAVKSREIIGGNKEEIISNDRNFYPRYDTCQTDPIELMLQFALAHTYDCHKFCHDLIIARNDVI